MNDGVYIFTHINYYSAQYSGSMRAVIIRGEEILLSHAIKFSHPPRKRLTKRLFELYFGIPDQNFILYNRILPQNLKSMQTTVQKIYKVK